MKGLGVDAAQIDAFDAHDDAALDHHIGQAHAVATALGAPDDQDHSALWGESGVETLAGRNGSDVVAGGAGEDGLDGGWPTGGFSPMAKAPRFDVRPPSNTVRIGGQSYTAVDNGRSQVLVPSQNLPVVRPIDRAAQDRAAANNAMIEAARGGPLGALAGLATIDRSPQARQAAIGVGVAADGLFQAGGLAVVPGVGRVGPNRPNPPPKYNGATTFSFDKNLDKNYYPPNDGFLFANKGTLPVGGLYERRGKPGDYLAPIGTPIDRISMPPKSKDEREKLAQYEVVRPMWGVSDGQASPWFGWLGEGRQIRIPMTDDEAERQGYFKRLDP